MRLIYINDSGRYPYMLILKLYGHHAPCTMP